MPLMAPNAEALIDYALSTIPKSKNAMVLRPTEQFMQHSDLYRSRPEKVAKEKAVSFEGEAEEGLKMPKHFPLANTKPLCRFLLQGVR